MNSEITVDPVFLNIVDQENQVSMKYGVQPRSEMNEAEGTKEEGEPLSEESLNGEGDIEKDPIV